MKKLFILLLIIPILGFSQYDLVYNTALSFYVNTSDSVTVPEGKVWKITTASQIPQGQSYTIMNSDGTYGGSFQPNPSGNSDRPSVVWIKAGSVITASYGTSFTGIEFNLVAASSSSGSGGGVSSAGFATSAIIDLEFSAVDNTGSIGASVDMGSLIVPEGKIWKIVIGNLSVTTSISGASPGSGYTGDVYVNGYLVSGEDKPIYLAAGTYQVFGDPSASGGGASPFYYTVKVGGIEYNAN